MRVAPEIYRPGFIAIIAILGASCGFGNKMRVEGTGARDLTGADADYGKRSKTRESVLRTAEASAIPPLSPHADVTSTVLTRIPDVASCQGKALPPARFWRLTESQIANTFADVFGNSSVPNFAGFDTIRFKERFGNDPQRVLMTPDLVFSSLDSVVPVTDWLATNVADINSCLTGTASCLSTLISKYGPLLWRRPLSADESQALESLLARAGTAGATQAQKVRLLMQALVLSPHFLFRSEVGTPAVLDGRPVRQLGPYEVASMLSYSLWASAPDQTLMALAAQGKLATPAQVKEQVVRMASDPKAKRGTLQVFDEWLGLREILTTPKDASYSSLLTAAVRADMREEVTRVIDESVWMRDSTVAEIFSSNRTFLNDRLAEYYGFERPGGNTFAPMTVDPAKRVGLLTSGAFVTAFSNDKGTGLVHRADFLLKHVLCSPLPPPPPGIEDRSSGPMGELTTRQRFELLHSKDPACASCHKSLDPIGGAFESWDSIGRFRIKEGNLPIDSSGNLFLGGRSEFTYQTGSEFLQKLAPSSRFSECYSIKAYQALAGVVPSDEYSCEVARLHAANKTTGFKPKSIFASFSDSNSLLYRDERADR